MDTLKFAIEIGNQRRETEWLLTVDRHDAIGVVTPKGWVLSVSQNRDTISRVMITPKAAIAFVESGIESETGLTEEMYYHMGTLIARYVKDFVLGDSEAEVVVEAFGGFFTAE